MQRGTHGIRTEVGALNFAKNKTKERRVVDLHPRPDIGDLIDFGLGKNFFKKIIEFFPEESRIILIRDQKKLCSGMFLLKVSKSELFAPTICTPRAYQVNQSSHLIYLEAAKEAKKLGCSVMNFGRSIDGSGPALFKKRFGLKAIPIRMYSPYSNWVVTNPKSSILRHVTTIWKKLTIPLTRLGGIIFAKHVI